MTTHRELLDALEERVNAPEFRGLSGGAVLKTARKNDRHLTLSAKGGGLDLSVDAVPMEAADAPDARPRIVLKNSRGGSDYADFSVDGLVMGMLGMLLAARHTQH